MTTDRPPLHIRFYREFGLESVYEVGPNAWVIIVARGSRMFAYGAASIIIALLFSALEISDFRIGLFMSLTLLGDVVLTLLLTLVADKVGRRRTLLLGSLFMVISGVTFATSSNYWILLIAAVAGVVSVTGSDFGPFRAIEESILSQLTTTETRSDVLTWYVTLASMGSAIGTEASGRVVDALKEREGWTIVDAYQAIFGVYIIMGLLNMACVAMLSDDTEAEHSPKATDVPLEMEPLTNEERTSEDEGTPKLTRRQSMIAQISKQTRSVMFKLWPLLIVDSLADGMVGYSLTAYYMERRFQIPTTTLGDVTSISYFLSASSTIFAGRLANRLGLINTMVFTHLPSSIAVLLFPLAPNLTLAIVLFFIRTGLNNMDQAPRSAFIAAVVQPSERTAVMGITSMLRTLAATTGPSVTGWLAQGDQFWIAFVAAGALRIAYDCGLWALFINTKIHMKLSRYIDSLMGSDHASFRPSSSFRPFFRAPKYDHGSYRCLLDARYPYGAVIFRVNSGHETEGITWGSQTLGVRHLADTAS